MSKNNNTPLHEAILHNDLSPVQFLIKQGADVNAQNSDGNTPLIMACKVNAPINVIAELIEAGADLNIQNKYGNLAITYCLNKIQAFRLLLEAGTVIRDINTLLLISSMKGESSEVLKYLIELGAKVNIKDRDSGMTPLMYACQHDREKTIHLLAAGARLDYEDEWERTAIIHCSPDQLELLIEAGADINGEPNPLYNAVLHGKVSKVKKLLELGADIHEHLIHNILRGLRSPSKIVLNLDTYNDILKLLIDAGANVNAMYTSFNLTESVLHQVVRLNNLTGLHLLLEAGADPYQVDSDGLVPMELTDDENMIVLLLSYMPALPPWWDAEYGELHDSIFLAREEAINTLAAEEEIYDPNLQKSILKYLYY
jgi:ankyrin repeat protein